MNQQSMKLLRKRSLLQAMNDFLGDVYQVDPFDSVSYDICCETFDYFEEMINYYLYPVKKSNLEDMCRDIMKKQNELEKSIES